MNAKNKLPKTAVKAVAGLLALSAPFSVGTTIANAEDSSRTASQDLFLANAPLQIININPPKNNTNSANSISNAFERATFGRYNPIVKISEVPQWPEAPKCLDSQDYFALESLKIFIKNYEKPEYLSIIDTNIKACEDNLGGFAVNDEIAVVTKSREYGDIESKKLDMVHEFGHLVGMDHAGIKECEVPEKNSGCSNGYATGDPNSIMSYEYEANSKDFTVADLYSANLLKENEYIENPGAGNYELSGLDHKGGLKALIIESENGEVFVVSNEPDETAGTKQICIRNSRDSKEDYYIVMIDEGVFKCHDKRINNNDHRTQIRQLNYAGYTALITKKPTNLKEKLMERSATPTEPGTILIEIGNTKLTFLGFNNNRGIVKVEST